MGLDVKGAARGEQRHRPGKPRPIGMCSLILPNHDLFMEMDGFAMSSLFAAIGEAAFYKRVTGIVNPALRAKAGEVPKQLSARQKAGLKNDFERLTSRFSSGFMDEVVAAIDGDAVAMARLDATGIWTLTAEAWANHGPDWQVEAAVHCAEVEQASQRACALLEADDLIGLADEITHNDRLSPYFSRHALSYLKPGHAACEILAVRGAGLMNFLLAQIARLSLFFTGRPELALGQDTWDELLVPVGEGELIPGRAFFRWFKRECGLKSLADMLDQVASNPPEVNSRMPSELTVKRWSSGKIFPDDALFVPFAWALVMQPPRSELSQRQFDRVLACHVVARRMDKLLRLMSQLTGHSASPQLREHFLKLLESPSVDEWMAFGYRKWLAHWQHQTAGPTAS
jgi:hypothetical protein